MEFFLKPLIARQPEEIILHIGTNDLSKETAEQVTNNITKLVYEIERHDLPPAQICAHGIIPHISTGADLRPHAHATTMPHLF